MKRTSRTAKPKNTGAVARLFGLGPASEAMLREAGVTTVATLERLGPVGAYIRVIESGARPSLNLLWGLASAVTGIHWSRLPADYRATLLIEYDAWCDQVGRAHGPRRTRRR
jgi:DNA transformation protein